MEERYDYCWDNNRRGSSVAGSSRGPGHHRSSYVAAAVAAMVGGPLPVQVIVFLAVSVIMLVIMRPIVRNKFNNRVERTNVEALPGSEGIVEERVTHLEPGAVRADGKVWSAVCADGETIEKDTVVVIKSIKGVTLMVEEKR